MGIRHFYDGLLSALSGAGRAFDRESGTCYMPNLLTDQQIEAAFRGSWLMRKIITKPATEMTRAGRDWQADKEAIEKIEAEEKRLGLKAKLQRAEVLRGKGGGGMVLYLKGDADQSQPIDPKRIGAEGLTRIHVWHRSRFTLGPAIEVWDDPWFGHPSYYEVQLSGTSMAGRVRFHPSRVVAFRGKEVDDVAFGADRWWWGDSMVEVVKEAVDNVHVGENGFAKLIRRSRIRRMGVPKLLEKFATTDMETQFTKRVAAIAAGENNDDITWFDSGDGEGKGGESITDTQMVWTGIPDIKASYLMVAAAAANMPATVLLGKSPDGMNATGDSDSNLWEQEVKARQDLDHRPCLDQLDVALIPSALGKVDDSVWWEFAPLSMMNEKDRATTDKTKAETVKIYADTGLLPTEALEKGVQNMLVEDGFLPGFDDALGELPEDERFPSRLAEDLPDPENDNGAKEVIEPSAGGGVPAQRPARRAANDMRFADDAEPKTLYIQRKLLNAAEVIRWAKAAGLETTLAADDMHLTIAFSRAPVDWFSVGSDWSGDENGKLRVKPGGPREVRRLGDGDAVALLFSSDDLEWRHKRIIEAGASWDWPEYRPHVTLTWNAPGVDVRTIAAYAGPLVFGPELFSEVHDDWKATITEDGGAPTGDHPFADAYDPGQPRDERGRWKSLGARIEAHADRALANKSSQETTSLGKVSRRNARLVKEKAGVDLKGYERHLQSGDIRHAMNSHGNPLREAARGQVALVAPDFASIPEIVDTAHTVTAIGKLGTGKGLRLEYVATIGAKEFRYVEQVRSKGQIVALKTMRRER